MIGRPLRTGDLIESSLELGTILWSDPERTVARGSMRNGEIGLLVQKLTVNGFAMAFILTPRKLGWTWISSIKLALGP